METENSTKLIAVSVLKPHPRNASIYGEEDVSDLIAQIQAYGGIADPLKVKADYTIISGHRRWKAAKKLGIERVPCEIVSYDSVDEELAALVMLNYHRIKTNEQKAREGLYQSLIMKSPTFITLNKIVLALDITFEKFFADELSALDSAQADAL